LKGEQKVDDGMCFHGVTVKNDFQLFLVGLQHNYHHIDCRNPE